MKLIDVKDVKAALLGWDTDPTDEEIEFVIDRIPTVDAVEVVHGQWTLDNFTHLYRCSVCNTVQPYDSIDDFIDPYAVYYDYWDCNYCPNCGTKMDKEN